MSNLPSEFPAIQGLSKRQQSKLQRLIKTTQAQQSNTHSKSYKRKPTRDKPLIDQPQRKLIKTYSTPQDLKSESGSSPIVNQPHLKPISQGQKPRNKVDPKHQKVYNPSFLKDQGQQGLFEYIMMYSYTEKQKQMDAPPQDLSFLDSLSGTKLNFLQGEYLEQQQSQAMKKFKVVKRQIEIPFNEAHLEFMHKNFINPEKRG